MKPKQNGKIYIVLALLLPFISCWVQWQFWSIFMPFVWFLFFPTVFFSSRIGGKYVGIASTLISTLLVVYFFIPPQLSFSVKTTDNLYSVGMFLVMGVLFSYTHDRLERSNRRVVEVLEASRIANEQLHEARIGRLRAEQELTEANLRRSEELFHTLFNKAPVPLCFANKDGMLTDFNERFAQMFGYRHEDVPTLSEWWQLAYPNEQYRQWVVVTWNAAVAKATATGSDIDPIEYNLTCKDGTVRTVLISGITLGDDLLATFFDVTERRQAEEALRESEASLKLAQRLAKVGNWSWDTERGLHSWSEEIYRIYGRDPGLPPAEYPEVASYFTPESWARLSTAVEFGLSQGDSYECDAEVLRADGAPCWIVARGNAERDSAGTVVKLYGTVQEITERKLAEELLRNSEAMYRSLFGNMMNGVAYCRMLFDGNTPLDFIYLSVNDAFEKQTGLKNVVGRPATEVIPGIRESDPGLFEIYGTVAMTGNPEQFEVYVNALKEWFWISVYSPEREHFVAVFDVITERRNLEEQLRQAQKMEAVGQLAGGVAHDFNNIMQVIMGNAQLQSMFNKKHDLNCRYVDEILKAVERGASLSRSLLVFSRKQPLELTNFDLNNLLQESHKLAMRLVTEEISLTLKPSDQALNIKGDAGLVQHVVFNLVTNARDAISRQGSITISTNRVTIDKDFIATHGATSAEGHYAMLTVKDTGCGISDQIRDRIFEPFFTTKEAGRGTGLGLAMIYGTVRQMGGFIVVESQPGAGTVIEIYIPLTDKKRAVSVASEMSRNVFGNGELILIVEDEEGVRDCLSQILIISDYRVICAANAEEAITLAREHSSELRLAIMDMILPGMNGMETARELHQIRPGLPTLFLSGYSDEALESKGITGYHLRKPVHPAQLLKQIRQLLDESPTE